MKVKINELAALEFEEAIEWYETQCKGLGKLFKHHVIEQVKKIRKNPTWFLIEESPFYKAYIPKFPYKILYSIEDDLIIIWAVAHLHRKPWYWQNRITPP